MVDDNLKKQMVFEENRKSVGIGYVLWLLLGWFGAHRIYAGKTRSGIAQLLLSLIGIGLIVTIPWWLIDAFLVPGMVHERNRKTIEMINGSGLYQPVPQAEPEAALPPRKPLTEADRRREAMLEDLRQTGYKKERRDPMGLYR